MIMASPCPMGRQCPRSPHRLRRREARASGGDAVPEQLLEQRLELVEDLWQTVLRGEYPADQSERLLRLKQLSDPVALEAPTGQHKRRECGPDQGHGPLRGDCLLTFSLYFQLINILEQRIEEDSYLDSLAPISQRKDGASHPVRITSIPLPAPGQPDGSSHLRELLQGFVVSMFPRTGRASAGNWTFAWSSQHPTEIVRHTVRHKQRRVASLLQRLQSDSSISIQERDNLRGQLEEEIQLWWRTDELHQFKPTVLDEVDSTLHYFQQVLFDAMPQMRRRLTSALSRITPTSASSGLLRTFGSGSDPSRWQPSVTPAIT